MPRAASTLQFQIVAEIVETFMAASRLPWLPEDELGERLADYALDGRKRVLKVHGIPSVLAEAFADRRAAGFYVHRDVRDVIPSLMDMFGYSFDEAVHSLKAFVDRHEPVVREHKMFVSQYDVLCSDIAGEAGRYMEFLGLRVDESLGRAFRERLATEYSLESQRTRVEKLSEGKATEDTMSFDAHHLLHEGHIRSPEGWSGPGGGLSREEMREVERVFGDWLRSHGYEL
jgi:hypothetical protein